MEENHRILIKKSQLFQRFFWCIGRKNSLVSTNGFVIKVLDFVSRSFY